MRNIVLGYIGHPLLIEESMAALLGWAKTFSLCLVKAVP